MRTICFSPANRGGKDASLGAIVSGNIVLNFRRMNVWYPTTRARVTPTMRLREFVHDPAPDEYFAWLNDLLEERYV